MCCDLRKCHIIVMIATIDITLLLAVYLSLNEKGKRKNGGKKCRFEL